MGIEELIVVGPVSNRVCSCNALIWSQNKHCSTSVLPALQ